MRHRLVGLALLAAAGCARTVQVAPAPPAPPVRDETIVLLPGPDGKVGSLTVTHEGQQQVLDVPYATARVQQPGTLEGGRLTADQVQQRFQPALSAQPPRPVTFVLYFLDDSDEFTPLSKREIPKISAEIAGHPAPEVVVIGHTDRVGSLTYNDALSLRRAERVRTGFVQMGIPREQISVAGRGEREPVVPTEDEVAEPRNRRVEITVR
jgi:outer membrane protein OmpA-like peptidoglycan-associated protein